MSLRCTRAPVLKMRTFIKERSAGATTSPESTRKIMIGTSIMQVLVVQQLQVSVMLSSSLFLAL